MEHNDMKAQDKDLASKLPSGKTTRPLSRKDFVVTGIDSSDITQIATIIVNGHRVHGTPADFDAERLADASITVTAPGYEELSFNAAVIPGQPTRITLKRLECTFHKTVRLTNGSKAELLLYGPRVPFRSSPLRGYRVEDDMIRYKGASVWTERLQGFLAALVLVFLCWLVYAFVFQPAVTVIPDEAIEIPVDAAAVGADSAARAAQEAPAAEPGEVAAVVYLDDNDSWRRDDLELMPQTKGLFDALNHYRVADILAFEVPLAGSRRFSEIVAVLKAQKPGRVYSGIFDTESRAVSYPRLLAKFKKEETADERALRLGAPATADSVR